MTNRTDGTPRGQGKSTNWITFRRRSLQAPALSREYSVALGAMGMGLEDRGHKDQRRDWLHDGNARALAWALGVALVLGVVALVASPLGGDWLGQGEQPADTACEDQGQDGAPAFDASTQGDSDAVPRDGDAQDGGIQGSDAQDASADQGDDSGLEDVDPSETPSDNTLEHRLDLYLEGSFPQTRMPGVAVAVVDADGAVYERTMGDIASTTSTTLVGSLSKSFTAVCVMQLCEQGRIDLDAPARSYLEEPGSLPDSVTVRDLLNQTSGLGYYDSLSQALARTEPGPTAGSFSYANANYDVLGRIVADVSGESYGTYLQEHVLGPLGMDRTSGDMTGALSDGTSVADSLTPGRRNWFGAYVADGFAHPAGDDAWGSGPSGYVSSSLSDMETYLRMYLAEGEVPGSSDGSRVLSADSVSSMFLDRVPDPNGDTYYGMGWTSFYWDDGELVLSHDGSVEGYCARMVLMPERGLGVVMLCDGSDEVAGSSLFFQMADGVVQTVAGDAPDPVDGKWYVDRHSHDDGMFAAAVLACLVSLVWVSRWRAYLTSDCCRPLGVVVRLAPYVVLPVVVLLRPLAWGVSWRDLLTFVPDVSAVLVACAALLVAAGVRRVAILFRARG